jgi:LysM repeat protein
LGGPKAGASIARGEGLDIARTSGGPVIVVKSGDTLAKLAARHEVSIAALMAVNGLRDPHIVRGQILMLPAQN